MSLIPSGLPSAKITGFRGRDSRHANTAVRDPYGLNELNVEYEIGEVRTRKGFYELGNVQVIGCVKALAWVAPQGQSRILLGAFGSPLPSGQASLRIVDPQGSIGLPVYPYRTNDWPGFLPWYNRIYVNGVGFPSLAGSSGDYPKYIWDPLGTPATYDAFRPPLRVTTELTLSTVRSASGNMTAGAHYVQVVFETKSGFLTRPSPVTAPGVASPGLITTLDGDVGTITATPTSNWPDDLAWAHLMITTASNTARYFRAPIKPLSVPTGTTTALNFVVTDSDAIIAQQEDWTLFDQRLTKIVANPTNWPFAVRDMFECGTRIGWILSSKDSSVFIVPAPDRGAGVFFSDPGDPEVITEQYHFLALPGGLDVITGKTMRSAIYLFGQDWTYALSDTGGYPVTWPAPKPISTTIGTPHINGVTVNPQGYALVAHESGLYVLSAGSYYNAAGYDARPLSWNQNVEWKKILWPTNNTNVPFSIVEDAEDRKIYVNCWTTDYTSGCIYVFDYSEGMTWDKVKFSIWTLPGNNCGAIALCHNYGDSVSPIIRQQLVEFPSGLGYPGMRKPDGVVNLYQDLGVVDAAQRINTIYKTSYLGQILEKPVLFFQGLTIEAEGSGALRIIAYGSDDVNSVVLRDTALTSAPGRKFERLVNLKNEGCALEFRNGTNVGDWFRLVSTKDDPMQLSYRIFGRRTRN